MSHDTVPRDCQTCQPRGCDQDDHTIEFRRGRIVHARRHAEGVILTVAETVRVGSVSAIRHHEYWIRLHDVHGD